MPARSNSGSFALACVIAFSLADFGAARADETSPANAAPQAKPYPEGINCVWKPSLRNGYYTVIDDSHLVLQGAGKKYYLLTLGRYCQDLDDGFSMALDARGGQLCGPGDSIVTRHDHCPIEFLEEVPNNTEAKSIVKARELARRNANR